MKELVSVNGKITKPEEAKISVYDRGFLFGDAVYEVTRTYGNYLFGLEAHLDRLFRSAKGLNINIDRTRDSLIKEMYDLVKQGGEEDIYIRIQISRGNCAFEQISLNPKNTSNINTVMYLHKLKKWSEDFYQKGISLVSSSNLRNSKKALDPNIKSGNYLNNIIAMLDSKDSKANDTIMLNSEGLVTEGTTFNIFMVKDSCVYTCPDDFDILQGITRGIVFELMNENSIKYQNQGFYIDDLLSADEVFVTSSTKEVMPVALINGVKIADGLPGVITKKLNAAYKNNIKKYCEWADANHPWS